LRIAVIAIYTDPTRLPRKEPSPMQSAVPEMIAGLCPPSAEIELFHEKEADVPLDREWDLVFFSYLHSGYEHAKVLSTLFRGRGMKTVAGGRHAELYSEDCLRWFDAVVTGDAEVNVPRLVQDLEDGRLRRLYDARAPHFEARPWRWDLLDFRRNRTRLPTLEASRGCPYSCNFCVLTGRERFRSRPVKDVVEDVRARLAWNRNFGGVLSDWFGFYDNNLGGSRALLRELCEGLAPLRKTWGCATSFDVLRDRETVRLMARAGCRYVYTGLESLDPDALRSMNKPQNRLGEVDRVIRQCYEEGVVLSFGLLVGSDGDTSEYLERLPRYLAELRYFSVTFVGIVCPYPGTPLFAELAREGRILPQATIRDFDGYTLCHRPKRISPDEVADLYPRICRELSSLGRVARHWWDRLGASDLPGFRPLVLSSAHEIRSIRNPVRNPARSYVAGRDAIERWDADMMRRLEIPLQRVGVPGVRDQQLPREGAPAS
jgi:radical SAM superfamily enzyme YgiQ (UPF0313 family)